MSRTPRARSAFREDSTQSDEPTNECDRQFLEKVRLRCGKELLPLLFGSTAPASAQETKLAFAFRRSRESASLLVSGQ
jgi:hypothetical protein